jgi:hypothetical protein
MGQILHGSATTTPPKSGGLRYRPLQFGPARSICDAEGGSGQAFVNSGQTAYAFSTGLPDKAYSVSLIDGASNVASALLGPRGAAFGTAILGGNYASDGGGESDTYSASSTFDFGNLGGDLKLGVIDSQLTAFRTTRDSSRYNSSSKPTASKFSIRLSGAWRSPSVLPRQGHRSGFDLGPISI